MAKKKTQAIIAQPGTPADGYTLDVKYEPENDDAFEAKAIFNDGAVKSLGSGGSGGGVLHVEYNLTDNSGDIVVTCNKTFAEISNAVQNGITLIPTVTRGSLTTKIIANGVDFDEDNSLTIDFAMIMRYEDASLRIIIDNVVHYSDDYLSGSETVYRVTTA